MDRVVRWLDEKAEKQKGKVLENSNDKQKRTGREETDGGKSAPE